jgi:nucleoside-diphosphate-sugar epimerase
MKILITGGNGLLSGAATKVFLNEGHQVYVLNRSGNCDSRATVIKSDINDTDNAKKLIGDNHFDAVIDFISFLPEHIDRAYKIFKDCTDQYIFISSASIFENPKDKVLISEKTKRDNPYATYSQNKILCEEKLKSFKDFTYTIVRPSHTYDDYCVPVSVHGEYGFYEIFCRINEEKPVVIIGDGTTFWTITHADDLAYGILSLVKNEKAYFEDFIITTDEHFTWNEIYKIIAKSLNKKLNPLYVPSTLLDDVSDMDYKGALLGDKSNNAIFDCSKIKSVSPDFSCKISFKERINTITKNILENEKSYKRDEKFASFCDKLYAQFQSLKNNF